MTHENDKEFWSGLWQEGRTRWDIGYAVPIITDYAAQLADKSMKILIPGAGNGYEAEHLHNHGFTNVYVLDIAKQPLDNLKARAEGFPARHLINQNFFEHEGKYDLILEYLFFITLHPSIRPEYPKKIYSLLNPEGRLVGSLLNDKLDDIDKLEDRQEGPPYGGTKEEYIKYFEPYFDVKVYETAYNSIKPREGRELFINFVKKEL
jgi:SAM-dependent methyltransferase